MKRLASFTLAAAFGCASAWADGALVKSARKTEEAMKATGGRMKDGAGATVEGTKKAARKTNESLTDAAAGVERAAKATGSTVKKGADATVEGAGKALDAAGRGLSNLGKRLTRKS